MKPSPINYAFAKDWPLKGYLSVWALVGVFVAISFCQPSRAAFADWTYCLLFLFSIVVAPVLFGFLSLPLAFPLLGPLYFLGGRLAGAPFRVGDRVRILIGPHRNRVVEIYDVWESRGQVRVHLDAQSEKDVRDVFSFTQVFRESTP